MSYPNQCVLSISLSIVSLVLSILYSFPLIVVIGIVAWAGRELINALSS